MWKRLVRVKVSTGLVGLPVETHPRLVCASAMQQLRDALQQVPADAAYRVALEKMLDEKHRVLADQGLSDEKVELELGTQFEEFIAQLKDEIGLVPLMAAGKPWDVPQDHNVDVEIKHH